MRIKLIRFSPHQPFERDCATVQFTEGFVVLLDSRGVLIEAHCNASIVRIERAEPQPAFAPQDT